ncbi:monofunctional biosynthetic peptidoglycan transglycosylase [Marinicella sp. W31]|uniref:monofunctional biosynthetic peptidoglycan transglycosylase n=1 Tax=Marinicella sp. W31 TaxID=3023713 RepID=UPI00375732F5
MAKKTNGRRKAPKKSFFRRLFKYFIRLSLAWLLITSLLVLSLRWFDPPTTAFMLQRQWQDEATIQQQWVDLENISPHLVLSVIASEDQKFLLHWGFDVQAIQQVLAEHSSGKKLRGASTISQQLAKNLFLWSGRSLLRKGLEAYFTAAIEIYLPKRRILELYLNVAELGDTIYGAEAAARHIYNIPARQLNRQQSALLAARLPAPKSYQINPPSEYMQQRAAWIRGQIKQLGEYRLLQELGL